MNTMKTYVALILDKSGSMSGIRKQAIDNFNEQLQSLKKESNSPIEEAKKVLLATDPNNVVEGIETRVSVVAFSDDVEFIDFDVDINDITEITEDEYITNGMTALYDAIGTTIEKFRKTYDFEDENTGALIVIITDGSENASKKYSRNIIKSQIDELTESGKWTFTFMGTENALDQADDLGILNRASFVADGAGMNLAANMQSAGFATYYTARSMGKTAVDNFYDEDDE